MKKFIHRLKDLWLLFARILGRVMTGILLTIVYVIVIGPMYLGAKVMRKDLLLKKKYPLKSSYWRDRVSNEPTIERYKYQF